jgi:dTDP-4-amino-4,6-dideoxygalactose transaminase
LANTPLILPEIDHKVIPVWQKFVIRTDNKHEFIDFLRCSGIESQPVYDYIISNCNFIEKDKVICQGEENSTKWSTSAVVLPMNPELTDDEIERVISVIHEYFK